VNTVEVSFNPNAKFTKMSYIVKKGGSISLLKPFWFKVTRCQPFSRPHANT